MNSDVNPFLGYESNATGGTEDLGGDFDLAGAAGRDARTGSVFGGRTASSQFPGLGMNPFGPAFRAETQTDPTIPPLPEEEGGEATAELEDPSAELLRSVCAGAREPSQTCENASSDRISRFAASQSVGGLVHDPVEDVGELDQPRV